MSKYYIVFKLAIENLLSRKARSILTILAIVYSIGLMICLETITFGIKLSITEQVLELLPVDIMIYSQKIVIPKIIINSISSIPSVEYVVPGIILSGTTSNIVVTIIGLPENSITYFKPKIIKGTIPLKDSVLIQDTLANRLHLDIGDNLKIKIHEDTIERDINLKISGIMESMFGGFMGFQLNMIVIPLSTLQDKLNNKYFINTIFIKLKESTNIEYFVENFRKFFPKAEIYTQKSIIKTINHIINLINTFFIVIIILSLIVAGLSIANTVMINIRERYREIGILKAIGASNKQIISIFIIEILIMTVIGSVIGIILGYIGAFFAKNILYMFGITVRIEIKPLLDLYVIGFLLAILIALLASIIPLRSIVKIKPIEVLRIE